MKSAEDIKLLREWLQEEGWSYREKTDPISPYAEVWQKVFPGAECSYSRQGGAPVSVNIHSAPTPRDVEISVRGQKPDGTWIMITLYALPDLNLRRSVETQVPRVVKLWNYACGLLEP